MDELRILYVEDSKTAQRLLEKAMGPMAEVRCASTVAQARQLLSCGTHNFFILDDELPDGSGVELAREIRAVPAHARTPIILYGASVDNETAYQAMRAGVNESHRKPMNMLELRERVAALVELPQIAIVRRELVQLTCFYWIADGRHHAYSPDLQTHCESASREQLENDMQTLIERDLRARTSPEDYPADIQIKRHVVQLVADRDAAA